jgi:hypothetical protein
MRAKIANKALPLVGIQRNPFGAVIADMPRISQRI